MKKVIMLLAAMLLFSTNAHAIMLLGSDWGTFTDTRTNRTWLQINYGYFHNYDEVEGGLTGSGFSFARESDMQELMASFYPTHENWYSIASTIGSDTSGSTMARFKDGGYAGFWGEADNYQNGWQYQPVINGQGGIGADVSDQAIGS